MDLYKNKDKLPVVSKKNDMMAPYKSTCADIGFKEGTEKFGQCVLKLYSRDKDKKKQMISEKKRKIQEARDRELKRLEVQEREQRMAVERERLYLEQQRVNMQRREAQSRALKSFSDRMLKQGEYAPPPAAAAPNVNVTIPDKRVHCQWIGYGASRQYYCN
jgi:hypothetical protein